MKSDAPSPTYIFYKGHIFYISYPLIGTIFSDNQAKLAETKKGATTRAKNSTTQNNKANRSSTGETTLNNSVHSSPGKSVNNSNKQLNNAAPQPQNSPNTQAIVPNKDKVCSIT